MHTADERITRCLQVMQDAFDGTPAYLEREGDTWTGAVGKPTVSVEGFKPTFTIALTASEEDPLIRAVVTYPSGLEAHTSIGTYDHLAKWAYDLSRTHGLQEWVTPRHFAHLVSRILVPCPYNGSWPHEHNVWLSKDTHLKFRWDEEECRLVALLTENGQDSEVSEFQHAGDAVGWLSLVQRQVQGTGNIV